MKLSYTYKIYFISIKFETELLLITLQSRKIGKSQSSFTWRSVEEVSSVASPICQEGQSERTFPIWPILPDFSSFSLIFPDFSSLFS